VIKRFRLGLLFLLLAALLLSATPVYADTPDPDTAPTVQEINLYQNLLVTGDLLALIYANIPYTDLPDTPVTETFIWQFLSTDNVTGFGSTVGTNYNDDGYGYNLYSIYLSADNVTSFGIVWGTSYTMRLSGNPAVFDTPPVYNFILNAGDYSTETVTADVKAELATRILTLADDLDSKWGLPTSLLTQNETATVLSTYGEAFFRGTIHGLQAMAPSVFSVIIRVIDVSDREWTDEYSENVTSQWAGTWIETAKEGGKVLFGTTYDLLSIILLLVMCGGLWYGNLTLTGDSWNGLIDVSVAGIIGARLAMFDLGFLLLIAALLWIYISAKIWFGVVK